MAIRLVTVSFSQCRHDLDLQFGDQTSVLDRAASSLCLVGLLQQVQRLDRIDHVADETTDLGIGPVGGKVSIAPRLLKKLLATFGERRFTMCLRIAGLPSRNQMQVSAFWHRSIPNKHGDYDRTHPLPYGPATNLHPQDYEDPVSAARNLPLAARQPAGVVGEGQTGVAAETLP